MFFSLLQTQFQLLKDNFNFKSFILDNVQGPGRLVGESGRYSEVREVVWHGLPVAAKEFTGDKYKARQCIREIYTWAPALRHTNIVQFFGLWEKNGSDSLPLIVMELLPCHLASFLNRWYILKDDRRFSVARNFILLDVSRGMAYLHSQNIMHRNLKAKSILLASNLVAKVGDFGTARFFDTEEKGKLTTPEDSNDVLPPEAYTKYYGLEVDRFSFGCVMIHCLIHKRPAPNSCEKLNPYQQRKHLTEDVLPDLYTKFQPIIKRCLDEIPENRISFPEIVEELCSIVSGAERSRSENILDTVVINLCSSNQQTIQSIKVNDDAIDSMESEKQLLDDYSVHGSVVPVVKKTDVSEKEDFLLGQRSLMILGISVSIVVLVIAVYFG
jgi:serine/threonine protein kinase